MARRKKKRSRQLSAPSPRQPALWPRRWKVPIVAAIAVTIVVLGWLVVSRPGVHSTTENPSPDGRIPAAASQPGAAAGGTGPTANRSAAPDTVTVATIDLPDPSQDGWESEVFHDASNRQLKKLAEKIARPNGSDAAPALREIVADAFTCADLRPASLVNLWASWCVPCAAELRQLTDNEQALRDAGLDVVALSVDALGDGRGDQQAAAELISRLGFPFEAGITSAAAVDRLQVLNEFLVQWIRPLPVPTSLLVDARGRVAVIYKGPVEVDQLLRDVELLSMDKESLLAAAFPFAGRWFWQPKLYGLEPLAKRILEKGHLAELAAWALRDARRLRQELDFTSLLITLGNQLGTRGDLQGAEAQMRMALREDPQLAVGHLNLGSLLLRQGRGVEAVESYREAVRLEPDDAVHHRDLGCTLAWLNRFDEAALALRRAVELDETDAEAHRSLGLAYEKQGEMREAAAAYSGYVGLEPDDTIVRRKLGKFLAQLGELDLAAAHLTEVVAQQPQDAAVLCELGRVLEAAGKVEEAIDVFGRAADIAPDLAMAHHLLGDAHMRQQEFGSAATAYRRTLALDAQRAMAANNLAWILATAADAALRDGDEAVCWAEHCTAELGREHPHVLDTLAAAYAEAGRFNEALLSAREGRQLAIAAGNDELAGQLEERLQLYENRRPYRAPE